MAKVEQRRGVSEEALREFFREMLLIRRFEEKVEERFRAGELRILNVFSDSYPAKTQGPVWYAAGKVI